MLKWIITALVRDIQLKHTKTQTLCFNLFIRLQVYNVGMYKYNNEYVILLFITTEVIINTVKI